MRKLLMALPIFAFVLAIAAIGSVAWSNAGANVVLAAQDPEVKTAEGELVKVDLENLTLTIKLENGDEIQFQYNSETAVEGRENGIQGLSSDAGTRLTVTYTEDSGKKIATKIAIKKSDT